MVHKDDAIMVELLRPLLHLPSAPHQNTNPRKCDINVLLLVIGDLLTNQMPFVCAIHYHSST